MLEVGLTVQVLGFDVGDTFRRGAVQQNQISWEELILLCLDNHTDLEVLPLHLRELTRVRVAHEHLPVVLEVVRLVSLHVLEYILDHGDEDDEAQRHQHHRRPARIRYRLH